MAHNWDVHALRRRQMTGEDGVEYPSSPEHRPSTVRSPSSSSSRSDNIEEDTKRWVRSASRTHQYLTSKTSTNTLPAGATGMENLGNTCYMNAVLQVLAHTQSLVNYIISGFYRDDINVRSATHGEVADEVARLLIVVWSRRFRFVSPHVLRGVIGAHRRDFSGTRMNDAHEYLMLLLEWLHDDLNVVGQCPPPAPVPDGLPDSEAAELSWRQFRCRNDSIISNLFYGQQKSTLLCTACGHESSTFETFSLLSLPLASACSGSGSSGSSFRCSLYHCLQQYVHGDLISGWTCPNCRRCHDVYKKFDIWRLPPVVIVHLKRFSYSGSTLRKAHVHVSFPLRDLDLSQLAIGPHPTIGSLVYDLYAVVEHHGSCQSGHYTAYCWNQPAARWYHIDDISIKETAASKVKDASAYMLCYGTREIT